MNEYNEINPNVENKITMTEQEKRSHKKHFSKLFLAFLGYLLISNVLVIVASLVLNKYAPALLQDMNASLIISSVIQYVFALLFLLLFVRKIPSEPPKKEKLGFKKFVKYALISFFFMYAGNMLSSFVLIALEEAIGIMPENSIDQLLTESNLLLSLVIVGIIGPIVEELMFRKIFVDRLTPYGDAVAILIPSLIFGLFHGNLYQFFYAFFLGAIFSYIYLKTGKLSYTIVLHCFINIFCGVLPAYLMTMFNVDELFTALENMETYQAFFDANQKALTLYGIYSFVLLFLETAGILAFCRNIKYVSIEKGKIRLPKDSGGEIMFFNAGAILLIGISMILIAINTFTV